MSILNRGKVFIVRTYKCGKLSTVASYKTMEDAIFADTMYINTHLVSDIGRLLPTNQHSIGNGTSRNIYDNFYDKQAAKWNICKDSFLKKYERLVK